MMALLLSIDSGGSIPLWVAVAAILLMLGMVATLIVAIRRRDQRLAPSEINNEMRRLAADVRRERGL
jgi:hypothetical protein